MNNYQKLENKVEEINKLNNLLSIIHWDMRTNMPELGIASRSEETALLADLIHKELTSPLMGDMIEEASLDTNLDNWQTANLALIKKFYVNNIIIDPPLLLELNQTAAQAEVIWSKARKQSDFNLFAPVLEKLIHLQTSIAQIKAKEFNKKPYDVLLDNYDPGQTIENLLPIHNKLKEFLPNFIEQVIEKQSKESYEPMGSDFSIEKQKVLGKQVMEKLGFDFKQGRLDESTHPFCGGTPYDIRITTRYNSSEFITSLEGIIHEVGHALYELNLPEKYKNQFVGKALGMSVHESQSLFMETQIGRSLSFMKFLSPLLNDFWDENKSFSPENLYRKVNKVSKGFIRVDADEVTYGLHVIIRFEIEQGLINQEIKVKDIPSIWNEKFKQYFGLTPPSDREGCLQDIHWAGGAFGYFPCYLNGAIIASSLMKVAQNKIINLDNQVSTGNFSAIKDFLKTNIQGRGSLLSVNDLLKESTGSSLNVEDYKEYLTKKFLIS